MGEQSWQLESYARFKEQHKAESSQSLRSQGGTWQQLVASKERSLVIQFKQPLTVVIQASNDVLESFSTADSKKWLKVISKSDSLLFFYKFQSSVRRFRIKFAERSNLPSSEACKQFVNVISPYVNIQKIDESFSQTKHNEMTSSSQSMKPLQICSIESSQQLMSTATENDQVVRQSITSLANAVVNGNSLPEYMNSTNVDVNEERIENQIKLYLMDPNFPAFVERVENILKSISN